MLLIVVIFQNFLKIELLYLLPLDMNLKKKGRQLHLHLELFILFSSGLHLE